MINFYGLFLIAAILLVAGEQTFSSQVSSSSTVDDLPKLISQDVRLRPYVKDLITGSTLPDKEQLLSSIEDSVEFQRLDFRRLLWPIFNARVWEPSAYNFRNSTLEEFLRPYRHQLCERDNNVIFLANILYVTGERLFEQTGDFSHLEHAATIGHPVAQRKMFTVYFKARKLQESQNMLSCSAAQGDAESLLLLSDVYRGFWGGVAAQNLEISKIMCQEAADLGNPQALFRMEVATLTEGLFGAARNYQRGIRKAKELADTGNQNAQNFLSAIMRSSGDALQEGNDSITYEDLDFLRSFLGWKDEND